MNNIIDVQPGDLWSDISYLQTIAVNKDTVDLKHLNTGETVVLSHEYLEKLLHSADQFANVVNVGIEDKLWTVKQLDDSKNTTNQVGDVRVPGMKSIWDGIGSKVFRVCFVKKGKELSKTAYNKLIAEKLEAATYTLEKAKTSKKGVTTVAVELLEDLIRNPIISHVPGEERILRGWKIQHESLDGQYAVMDSDLMEKRVVNLNTIKWIIVDGVKYVKE